MLVPFAATSANDGKGSIMKNTAELTREQKRAFARNRSELYEIEQRLREVYQTARERLAEAEWIAPTTERFPCIECACEDWEGSANRCETDGCGHPGFAHWGV
ncbi:hypothetical protein [Saccharomonospora sp. NB11]|jgi:hypothetical protein|uniref:hypothetical protein n=1 Tax=Saccharomonospora sp. NB11 TaxID=1642298 RepID=UPI0018D1AC28|nr:hypothetical protein [Saccharomonospora sp. NB11]